jgi:thioesterase domain-containing protein
VYGIQSLGLEHDQALPADVEGMVAAYVAAIRVVQPAGPYLLCGWSVGGVIALEIAQQLDAHGQTVALLALLDSHAPQPIKRQVPNEDQLLVGMARQLGLMIEPVALQPLDAEQQLAYVLAQAQRNDALSPGLDLAQFQRLFAVYRANALALLRYVPRPYAGRVTLFRVDAAAEGRDPVPGWSMLAIGGVTIFDVPGEHDTMLQEPYVRVLADHLMEAIVQAQMTKALTNNQP